MKKNPSKHLFLCIFIILFLYIVHLLFTRNNYDAMYHVLFKSHKSSVPINYNILDRIKELCKSYTIHHHYRFIDIGCGEGRVLQYFHHDFDTLHGIEIDRTTALYAIHSCKVYPNITIFNQDFTHYKFENCHTLIYLYEPLWLLPKEEAIDLYQKFFAKIQYLAQQKSVSIIYVSGAYKNHFMDFMDKKYLLHKEIFGSYFFHKKLCLYRIS